MASRKRSRAQRKEDANARTVWIVAAVVAAVAVGMLLLYLQSSRDNPELATDTLCPASGPSAVSAVVVDTTDAFGAVTRADVRARILAEADRLPRFGRLALYGAGADESKLLTPAFSKCNPGRGADVNRVNASPELVEREYERGFRAPLEKAVDNLLDSQGADASPILEGVQAVGVSAFPPGSEKEPRRLVLVSDMLQNSKRYSMYRAFDPAQGAAAAAALKPNLDDVGVTILIVGRDRDAAIQARSEFLDYWTQWFSAGGARVERVVRLAGRN